ncbi:hypothetical protein [Lichenifustis flavocetrariae]|uniref:Uncharacterized protein n=1 Tax=Lichenifustis flavocetrariae TaxID=2949735 RepID=A0AA41YW38_9HYPH|nr:hypothetical protein [Lichenifustis flavocetrariae]MCW6509689.1 hypothetical protein [Lichenifustis flavocetrariae]
MALKAAFGKLIVKADREDLRERAITGFLLDEGFHETQSNFWTPDTVTGAKLRIVAARARRLRAALDDLPEGVELRFTDTLERTLAELSQFVKSQKHRDTYKSVIGRTQRLQKAMHDISFVGKDALILGNWNIDYGPKSTSIMDLLNWLATKADAAHEGLKAGMLHAKPTSKAMRIAERAAFWYTKLTDRLVTLYSATNDSEPKTGPYITLLSDIFAALGVPQKKVQWAAKIARDAQRHEDARAKKQK